MAIFSGAELYQIAGVVSVVVQRSWCGGVFLWWFFHHTKCYLGSLVLGLSLSAFKLSGLGGCFVQPLFGLLAYCPGS